MIRNALCGLPQGLSSRQTTSAHQANGDSMHTRQLRKHLAANAGHKAQKATVRPAGGVPARTAHGEFAGRRLGLAESGLSHVARLVARVQASRWPALGVNAVESVRTVISMDGVNSLGRLRQRMLKSRAAVPGANLRWPLVLCLLFIFVFSPAHSSFP